MTSVPPIGLGEGDNNSSSEPSEDPEGQAVDPTPGSSDAPTPIPPTPTEAAPETVLDRPWPTGWASIVNNDKETGIDTDEMARVKEKDLSALGEEQVRLTEGEQKPANIYAALPGDFITRTFSNGNSILDIKNIDSKITTENYPFQIEKNLTPILVVDGNGNPLGIGIPAFVWYKDSLDADRLSPDGADKEPFIYLLDINEFSPQTFSKVGHMNDVPQEWRIFPASKEEAIGSISLTPRDLSGFTSNTEKFEEDRQMRMEIVAKLLSGESPEGLLRQVFWGPDFWLKGTPY